MVAEERREKAYRGARVPASFPARHALEVVVGDASGGSRGDGEVDDVLQMTANPETVSARSFSSWNGAGWRLELRRAEASSW
jgi:hypothetical protein